ncbi:MAG: sulfatase/phosphatase domain-containing protein, partial [Verrucomicrobiota bacterium]
LKGSLYEGGIRVPLIVKWPGKIEAGSTSDFITGFEDWMPTLLQLAAAETKAPAEIDGISIAPTLLGKVQGSRDFLYREFTGYGGQQAVWMGKWKGIRQEMLRKNKTNPLKTELYNMDGDISEANDVAADHPDIVAKIEQIMKEHRTPDENFPFKPLDE